MRIADLLRVPERYLRSVHLERDFDDVRALERYVVTVPMVTAFRRIVEGLRPESGRRAWRITGDYGSGKSSFALVLAHLLRDATQPALAGVHRIVDFRGLQVRKQRLVPVLITSAREGIVPAVARAIARTIHRLPRRGAAPRALANLAKRAAEVASSNDGAALVEVLTTLCAYAIEAGHTGVLLVLDELGKALEYAALHPDREDVYALQQLAEAAARSGDRPILLVGLLHQGFHVYAERLPSTARHEWEKVAGRFEEIVFDQPLGHVTALAAGALDVDMARVPASIVRTARAINIQVKATGWFRGNDMGAGARNQVLSGREPGPAKFAALSVYPLHPTVLPVLVRFFARFGQHERSLFSFLLSSEPFAVQGFADRPATGEAWYRLADFYDYVRTVYGHQLAGASYQSQWLRIIGVVDGLAGVSATELGVLKTVAVLNTLDSEHLLATDAVLTAAVAVPASHGGGNHARSADGVREAVAALRRRGVLFDRGAAGGYCLWPNSSVNLEEAFEIAQRALGPIDRIAANLAPFLDSGPLLARRHSIETGTSRYFEVRYADTASLRDLVLRPTDADGVVVIALCDTEMDRLSAESFARTHDAASRPEVLIAVPRPLIGLAAELQDARCWQWVADNTPEFANDNYAAAEAGRQLAAARRALTTKLAAFFGRTEDREGRGVTWTRAGRLIEVAPGRGLLATLSRICDELYARAPLIRNELLNRRALSSAAAAARMRLIERMFTAADRSALGIDPLKAPPEKSMYLSVLAEGRVHREAEGRHFLAEPAEDDDPLRLRPALQHVMALLESAQGHRVSVAALNGALRARPYGVRTGVIPIVLAIVAIARAHEIAVYEAGTFLRSFGPADFLRLTKLPTAFEFQLCRVTGVRLEVFDQLVKVFAAKRPGGRRAELLDVVTPLCVFAAHLPEYTRKTTDIPARTAAVRNSLLASREPGPLVFQDLPLACGMRPFRPDEPADRLRVVAYVRAVQGALDDLRAAYPQLLDRIAIRIVHALGLASSTEYQRGVDAPRLGDHPNDSDTARVVDRQRLADRAGRVGLAAREPRLRAFANRLGDVALPPDAWVEAMGSFLLAKPPTRWAPADEARAGAEIDALTATFRRVEAVAFKTGPDEAASAVRVSLTRGDGAEAVEVVHTKPEDEAAVSAAVTLLAAALPADTSLRIKALSWLLWKHLEETNSVEGLPPRVDIRSGEDAIATQGRALAAKGNGACANVDGTRASQTEDEAREAPLRKQRRASVLTIGTKINV